MLINGWWIWISDPVGASETNDIGLANRQKKELKRLFEPRDIMVADRGFQGLDKSLKVVYGWSKVRGQALEDWQMNETSEVSNQRGIFFQF